MPTDILTLGPIEFTDFAVPDRMPGGGKQAVKKHKLPGGGRRVDAMGPDDDDRKWSGIFWGNGAVEQALTLDALRKSGAELPYSWAGEARLVIITDFIFEVEKVTCVHYAITCMPTDDDNVTVSPIVSLSAMVIGDLSSALDIANGN